MEYVVLGCFACKGNLNRKYACIYKTGPCCHLDQVWHGKVLGTEPAPISLALHRLKFIQSDWELSTRVSCFLFCLISIEYFEWRFMTGRHNNIERVENKSTFVIPLYLCQIADGFSGVSQTPWRYRAWRFGMDHPAMWSTLSTLNKRCILPICDQWHLEN